MLTLFFYLTMSLAVAGCGADRTGGPRGDPAAVVDAAPDRTMAAGRARFEASAPDAERTGMVDFGANGQAGSGGTAGDEASGGDGEPTGADPAGRVAPAHPELSYPRAVVDLVRGALAVESYGGAAVRGASTFRYETVINVERAVRETPVSRRAEVEELARRLGAPAFYADVWIDDEGRLRRVQVPVEKTTERPAARSKRLPQLVTVDFFDFGRTNR